MADDGTAVPGEFGRATAVQRVFRHPLEQGFQSVTVMAGLLDPKTLDRKVRHLAWRDHPRTSHGLIFASAKISLDIQTMSGRFI